MVLHPRPDDKGNPVTIHAPSTPTPLFAWLDPGQAATVLPDGPMPHELNGLPFHPWRRPPESREEWTLLAEEMAFDEPPFTPKKTPAAGAAVVEPDGRVWLVSPTNAHGGYKQTFAKGTVKHLSLKATALKEVFEESGLRIELLAHLVDVDKSQSSTRYYLARRIGGTPSAMGWESQSAHLAPLELVKERLNQAVDHAIVDRLMEVWGSWAGRFREPLSPRPGAARQRSSTPPQVGKPSHMEETTGKWASQDADAIAAQASAALKAGKQDEAIKRCKHAAVILHHQGKMGLAGFFASFVKQAIAKGEEADGSPSPSLLDEPMTAPTIGAIRRHGLSRSSHIFEVQAKFMAHLILELEAACLRAFGFKASQEIRWSDRLSPSPWDLPEYRRFIEGGPACGFVVNDLSPEEWLDLDDINRQPEQSVPIMGLQDIREYLHTLNRCEKWADCTSSPVFEALASGALQVVATRLQSDESLYEPF